MKSITTGVYLGSQIGVKSHVAKTTSDDDNIDNESDIVEGILSDIEDSKSEEEGDESDKSNESKEESEEESEDDKPEDDEPEDDES